MNIPLASSKSLFPGVPYSGFVDLDAKKGILRAPQEGIGKIAKNYLPPMNSVGPVPKVAKAFTLAETMRYRGASGARPDKFSWHNPEDVKKRMGYNFKITGPQNQHECGCCYAMSSATVLADRWAIGKSTGKGSAQPVPLLSTVMALSCSKGDAGCDGGLPYNQGQLYETQGLPLDACNSFADFCKVSGSCRSPDCAMGNCSNSATWYATKGSTKYLTDISDGAESDDKIKENIEKMKNEIWNGGPIVGCFWVYDDFFKPDENPDSWPGGIYKRNPNSTWQGGHAVAIVGYCEDGWVIRNSWSTDWNEAGFCRVYDAFHGNRGVGFDHTIQKDGSLLGGAVAFDAKTSSGSDSGYDSVGIPSSLKLTFCGGSKGTFPEVSGGGGSGSGTHVSKGFFIFLVIIGVILFLWFLKKIKVIKSLPFQKRSRR